MKKCIICDNFLRNQNEQYNNNHYLCGNDCAIYYVQCYNWQNNDINLFVLNDIRKETFGINELMMYEIDRRIDK